MSHNNKDAHRDETPSTQEGDLASEFECSICYELLHEPVVGAALRQKLPRRLGRTRRVVQERVDTTFASFVMTSGQKANAQRLVQFAKNHFQQT